MPDISQDTLVDNGTVRAATPPPVPKAGIIGGFDIMAKLGEGGMGTVFKARQPLLNRVVALKVMAPHLNANPDFVSRFFREASMAANLTHPNMVQVHSAGEDTGRYYIAMEFVDGESLLDRLSRLGKLKPTEAVAITVYIAEALNFAWQRAKLIHRDIKPDNIFLSGDGEVKLGDLGLAKSLTADSPQMTNPGMMMGTPHYMSPEQARAESSVDFRTDIYSLGCTLFHMLTGKVPYTADSSMAVVMKHIEEPVPDIVASWPSCPPHLTRVVTAMMAKRPEDRFQSYDTLIAELNRIYDELSGKATFSTAPAVKPDRPKRQYLQVAALIGVGVVVLTAAGVAGKYAARKSAGLAAAGGARQAGAGTNAYVALTALPAEQQLRHVLDQFKTLNPGFSSSAKHTVQDGRLVGLDLANAVGLHNLSPLKGLPLKQLDISGTEVSDLSPLRGMPLEVFRCSYTEVNSLAPLARMPLTELYCDATPVKDLSALTNMPLRVLRVNKVCLMNSPANREIVIGLLNLKTINGQPAPEVIRQMLRPAAFRRPPLGDGEFPQNKRLP
jgi:hypothetical protein